MATYSEVAVNTATSSGIAISNTTIYTVPALRRAEKITVILFNFTGTATFDIAKGATVITIKTIETARPVEIININSMDAGDSLNITGGSISCSYHVTAVEYTKV